MKTIVTLSTVLILLYGPTLLAPAQTSTDTQRNEIINLIQQHDDALNQHDLEKLLSLYAPGPRTVILGTGPGERYQGRDEIRTAYTEFFKDFDKGTLTRECYWKDGEVTGTTTAWVAAMCKFNDSLAKKPREYEINLSASLQKSNNRWQFTLLHFSQLIGTPPEKQTVSQDGRR